MTADGGDYTVHIVVGVDPEWRIYVLDLWREQTSAEKWVETFCDLVRQWKPIGWAEERGRSGRALGRSSSGGCATGRPMWLERSFRPAATRRCGPVDPRPDGAGRAYVPMRAPWYADFRAELLSFPAGKHDDQVDALGLIGQVLNKMTLALAKAARKGAIHERDDHGRGLGSGAAKAPRRDARI